MNPVTLEDHALFYLETSNGCSTVFVTPPPPECPKQVHQAYGVLQYHFLTGIMVFLFCAILLQFTLAPLMKGEGGGGH